MSTEMSISEVQEHADPRRSPFGRTKDNEFSLLDLVILVLNRKRKIALITCSFAIASIVISLVLPQWYTASVTILPPQQSSSMSAALTSQLGNFGAVAALAGGSLNLLLE